jgi:RNA polymerase sigma-70 factor, ECF subfamily
MAVGPTGIGLPRVMHTLSSTRLVKSFPEQAVDGSSFRCAGIHDRITPDANKLFPVIFQAVKCCFKMACWIDEIMDVPVNKTVFSQATLAHIDALYGYAMTLTRDTTEADDLVQETYLRATSAANQPQPNGNLKAWLFVIMRNAWLNQVRHNQSGPRFVELETNEQPEDALGNPHVVYLRKLEREQVRDAIDKLPEAYREIVVLRDIEGFTYHEIAMVLDCPAGTVMSRLGRARAKLRASLATWQTKVRARAV